MHCRSCKLICSRVVFFSHATQTVNSTRAPARNIFLVLACHGSIGTRAPDSSNCASQKTSSASSAYHVHHLADIAAAACTPTQTTIARFLSSTSKFSHQRVPAKVRAHAVLITPLVVAHRSLPCDKKVVTGKGWCSSFTCSSVSSR